MTDLFAGVDLGGTNVTLALGTAGGEIAASSKVPTRSQEGPEAVLRRIAEGLQGLAREAGRGPAALGMGVPGLADLSRGVTKFLPNLPTQWRDVPVASILSPALGCEVYLLNDVRAATFGELAFGLGREAKTLVFFAVGTGVGGGIAVDGRLRLGPLGAAGELGHMTILPDGPACGCGSRGCLETLASGPAIAAEGVRLMLSGLAPRLHEIAGGQASAVTPETMARAAREGDANVREAVARAGRFLGIGAATMVTALHPDLVVLGGGVAGMEDLVLEPLREEVRRRVRMMPAEGVRIETSALGDRAGLLGALALAARRGRAEV